MLHKKEEMESTLEHLLAMDGEQRRVHGAAERLRQLLTDACPRCHKAVDVVDMDGCCALQCSHCPCSFCAWCLQDCGADAHSHVVRCTRNLAPGRNLFASQQLWRDGRMRSKQDAAMAMLGDLSGTRTRRARVVEAVSKELVQVGLGEVFESRA